ncbi:dihydroneopterin aldolase [Thiohalospira halophila DSM 15071]|uniref:7,8-dihydroneopterin aldolase n=1 Tax=Thiohalospira halophila DSM 15071 TaxID=1123397 RepID=A0A1I1V1Y7_9GAMM|nr:dihydroneopterin aldolase [Thiohalospira halophila]SFD76018.1 dihydroneopterin aldolase [Thiohalospira halophila DSM 15071]
MDTIYLTDLRLEATLGVPAWERALPQPVRLDLELEVELAAAGASDDVADTVDYAAVTERLRAVAADGEYRLLEALAERLAATVLGEFPVAAARLRLDKSGAVPGCGPTGVAIRREAG